MKKFELMIGDQSEMFGANQVKYFFGDNYQMLDRLKKTFRHIFQKCDDSDYVIEENKKINLFYEEQPINLRNSEYYELSSNFDLLEELKLKSKSLLGNVLLSSLEDIEYNEEYNTLNILFEDFADTICDLLPSSLENIQLDVQMKPLDSKSLVKQLEIQFKKDETHINPYELSYEDYIKIQIELIAFLAEKNISKTYFVVLDIPTLTKPIHDILSNLILKNIHILVIANHLDRIPALEEIVLVHKNVIDLANDEDVYNSLTLRYQFSNYKVDLFKVVNEYLQGISSEKTQELLKIL